MKTSTFKMLALLLTFFSLSCSKDDTVETTITGENGGQISRFQLVTVDFGSNTLPNDTYTGTFNNEPVTLSKIEDNKLLFYVKESTPLGQTQLLIPALNNTKIIYEVVEATLTQSPAATLQPLMDFQAQYGATLTNAPEDAHYLQNHNAFTQYFADLSDDDRIKAAKFYKTNKAIFDPVYTTNYDAIQGRMANKTQADFDFQLYRSLILRHKLAVAVTVISATFAATPPYDPIETSLASLVALAGIKKSSDFHKQIIVDVFRVVQVKLNNELGLNNRMANAPNAALTLTDNQATTLPFAVNAKNFSNTDSNVQKEFVQTYFTAKNKLNGFINDLNTAINWINNNVPLLTLSTINTVDVPATAALNSFATNAQVMQRFSFSVNHPNLSLENASLQSDGQLNLKVKFVGNPTATTINSTLNYTYNDYFSSFSGSFPIEIQEDVNLLIGNWILVSASKGTDIDYTLVGQSSEPFDGVGYGFRQQYYIPMPGNATFTPSSFTINTSISIVTNGMIMNTYPKSSCDVINTYNESYTLDNYSYPQITLNNYIEINNINSTHNLTNNRSCDNGDNNTYTSSSTNKSQRKLKLENENTLIFETNNSSGIRYKFIRQ